MKRSYLFFALFLLAAAWADRAEAARLYLDPLSGTYLPGATIPVTIRLDNEGECVNAAEVNLSFPKDLVEAVDVSRGDSIFSIWVTPPTIRSEYGLVTFIGGIPGGYCGRTPGDPAITNVLSKVIFRIKDKLPTKLPARIPLTLLGSSKVVLNDGRGTETKLSFRNSEFIASATGSPRENTWTQELAADKTPPESFAVTVQRDKSVFEDQYFAVWSAVDKQTGLDHYEILETRTKADSELRNPDWRRTESPFVLKDQSLKSRILVKAVDKAGNERISEYRPFAEKKTAQNFLFWALASLGLILVAVFRFLRFIPW
jgi:hypothetical protein